MSPAFQPLRPPPLQPLDDRRRHNLSPIEDSSGSSSSSSFVLPSSAHRRRPSVGASSSASTVPAGAPSAPPPASSSPADPSAVLPLAYVRPDVPYRRTMFPSYPTDDGDDADTCGGSSGLTDPTADYEDVESSYDFSAFAEDAPSPPVSPRGTDGRRPYARQDTSLSSVGMEGADGRRRDGAWADEETPLVHGKGDNGYGGGAAEEGGGTERGCAVGPLIRIPERWQSVVLGVAFAFVWSPNNLMAPNLTAIATDFGLDDHQRDLYLGAYISFATGVLSIPIMAAIGFASDFTRHRVRLYTAAVAIGGLSSIATGDSATWHQLYWCRFVCGGCMCGCVPVAYSLLGDLFEGPQRNAASSGLAACMGAGMLLAQVYAGKVGPVLGWERPFVTCGRACLVLALAVALTVREPVRGGKELALREIVAAGGSYEKRLDWEGFWNAMTQNRTNFILIMQGFVVSVPWGIIFCFLNDYLSQERGLSVEAATTLVAVFGLGCAVGSIGGGYLGQVTSAIDRRLMPVFMAVSTLLGILPMLALINCEFHHAGLLPCLYAFLGGSVANLPSVNVRPILINVNPPEIRGATLTAANLVISLARGLGPSFMTTLAAFGASRTQSFNILIISFWTMTALQLLVLVWTIPADQDKMEEELRKYVTLRTSPNGSTTDLTADEDGSLVTISHLSRCTDMRGSDRGGLTRAYSLKERAEGLEGRGVEIIRRSSELIGTDYAFHL